MTVKRLQKDPVENSHTLKCKIKVKEITYDDIQSKGSQGLVTRKIVGLMPHESSEMSRCFAARLGLPGKLVECILQIDHPFHQYARGAILHPKSMDPEQSHFEDHHIFLMSYGLSQIIIAKPSLHDKDIIVTVLPEGEDHPDGAPTDDEIAGEDLIDFDRKDIGMGL